MGTIVLCGSEEQQRRWLPAMQRMELIGAFGLTEPDGGSDVAGGMRTTAKRSGDQWVLNGAKRWIGNATFADLTIIWARDVDDDQVKGFVVEKGHPRFRRDQDREQGVAADRAERRHRADRLPGRRGEPAAEREFLPGHRPGAADHPRRRDLVGGRLPDRRL